MPGNALTSSHSGPLLLHHNITLHPVATCFHFPSVFLRMCSAQRPHNGKIGEVHSFQNGRYDRPTMASGQRTDDVSPVIVSEHIMWRSARLNSPSVPLLRPNTT